MSRSGPGIVIAALLLSAVSGFAQMAADHGSPARDSTSPAEQSVTLPAVSLEECVAAARVTGPTLTLAGITQDTARSALAQARAASGLTLGETADYFHRGNLPGFGASSTASSTITGALSGSGLNSENIQGGLSLTGPATNLGLTAQHSIGDGAPNDQVSSLGISASQTVFDGYPGGRAAGLVKQAEAAYRISQVVYDAAAKALVYQVKQAYYTLLGDQDTVLLRQATSEQASENLDLYHGLFTAQRATKLDVLQVDVAMTQARLDVLTAENTVVTDRKKLSLAVGWPVEKEYSVADSPLPSPPSLGSEQAEKSAFQNRSELLTMEQNIVAADIALSLQKSRGLPVVSLTGSLDVSQDWTSDANTGSFTAGVSIALPPIYDAGLQNAQVQQAADLIAAYRVQQAQLGQSIRIDVGSALFGVTDARDRNALAAQNMQQAQGQYDLEKAKLSAGSGKTLDVLTAFSVLATARVGLAQAKSNYLLAVLNLYNVMGL